MPPTPSAVFWPRRPVLLELGGRRYDLTTRALVVGILNRTTDSFYDHGSYFELDRFFEHAEQLVEQGADVLDVGGVKAGPGPEVTEEEELDRVVPVIASLRERFDVPLSVDTWRASVAAAAFGAGAVLGNDISGFADPAYLEAAAAAGASVVATHIRLSPRVPDPDPHYDDVVADVERFLLARAESARSVRDPGRSHNPRRRPRPRQDGRTVTPAAAELRAPRLTRLPACSCPRRTRPSWGSCWTSGSASAAMRRWPQPRWASPAGAAWSGSMTSPGPARCATSWPRSPNRPEELVKTLTGPKRTPSRRRPFAPGRRDDRRQCPERRARLRLCRKGRRPGASGPWRRTAARRADLSRRPELGQLGFRRSRSRSTALRAPRTS